ncbi:MAG: hypothetical protein Q9181_006005 [Wetmoreana brouardii]
MEDPFTPTLSFAASAVRFIAQLSAVKDETGVVIGQVKVVANVIAEAERLYLKNKRYLGDADQSRVEEVIRNTRVAVNRIAKEVEPARKSVKKVRTVNVVARVDWILRKSGSTETYQHSLETCHRSLLDRISMLRGVRAAADDQAISLSQRTPVESHNKRAEVQSDFDEDDDEALSSSSNLDDSDPAEDPGRSVSPNGETIPTTRTTHPERALYEATQLNHLRKSKKQKSEIHPERLLYEEMQRRIGRAQHD